MKGTTLIASLAVAGAVSLGAFGAHDVMAAQHEDKSKADATNVLRGPLFPTFYDVNGKDGLNCSMPSRASNFALADDPFIAAYATTGDLAKVKKIDRLLMQFLDYQYRLTLRDSSAKSRARELLNKHDCNEDLADETKFIDYFDSLATYPDGMKSGSFENTRYVFKFAGDYSDNIIKFAGDYSKIENPQKFSVIGNWDNRSRLETQYEKNKANF